MEEIWAKTILGAYKRLDGKINLIDKAVNNLSKMPQLSAEQVTTKIVNLTEQKVNLINLKILTEQILSKCSNKHIRVLYLKYVLEKTASEISEIMNLNIRTIFRLLNTGFDQFVNNMMELGFTPNYLYKNYRNEKMVISQFRKEYINSQNATDNTKTEEKKKAYSQKCINKNLLFSQFRKNLS